MTDILDHMGDGPPAPDYVYYALCQPGDNVAFIKIGRGKRPRERLADLRTGCHFEIDVFGIMDAAGMAPVLEKALHDKFADFRMRSEWFCFDMADEAHRQAFKSGWREVFDRILGPGKSWKVFQDKQMCNIIKARTQEVRSRKKFYLARTLANIAQRAEKNATNTIFNRRPGVAKKSASGV